ncbi:MAG: type II toxin-antitoxin system Phd/YefM family antitoxin [Cyanobacteria bacterium P01_F01_bin.143]
MTIYVNQQEAEQQFSQLFSQVLQGEEIIISVEGQEKARLVPSSLTPKSTFSKISQMRVPGIDEGRFVVPDDFDEPLPIDLLQAFEDEV